MNGGSTTGGGGGGPCGACKFLRRKCVKGCVFAPYFDSDQGTAHFAAVHKVFGASNASKLISRLPLHRRLDAVVTLCYEALARIRDPVYGCVAHIFTLQQQVVNLQAELAYIQGRISTLQRLHLPPVMPRTPVTYAPTSVGSSDRNTALSSAIDASMGFDHLQLQVLQGQQAPTEWASSCHSLFGLDDGELDDGDLHALAREFVTRYLPGVRFKQE